MAKRIAIIGAGCSGLTSVKSCLEEGLEPMCFEMSSDIGGLWNFSEKVPTEGDRMHASVYKSCSINTSKEMMAFSDFPIPADFPPFMPHHKVLEYFRLYAKHFKLLDRIQFDTKVISVEQTDCHGRTGCWTVCTQNMLTQETTCQVFDGVMVCSGHHRYPHRPLLEGMSRFKGKVLHSSEYKNQRVLEDKKVLVVGGYFMLEFISKTIANQLDSCLTNENKKSLTIRCFTRSRPGQWTMWLSLRWCC